MAVIPKWALDVAAGRAREDHYARLRTPAIARLNGFTKGRPHREEDRQCLALMARTARNVRPSLSDDARDKLATPLDWHSPR